MSHDHILHEVSDRVMTITMARPKQKNALTVAMYSAMNELLDSAASDPNIRAVIFRGQGGNFTSGNDLGDFLHNPPVGPESPVLLFLSKIRDFEKPLLCAVEGYAVGIGTTMLLHCDLSYAAPNTTFKMPFATLGLVPEAGSSYILPRLMGHAKASELLLLCDAFTPEKAEALGILTDTTAGDVYEHTRKKALILAAQAPAALRKSKSLMKRWNKEQLTQAMNDEAVLFAKSLQGPEAMEALKAFMEKRSPDFSSFE